MLDMRLATILLNKTFNEEKVSPVLVVSVENNYSMHHTSTDHYNATESSETEADHYRLSIIIVFGWFHTSSGKKYVHRVNHLPPTQSE